MSVWRSLASSMGRMELRRVEMRAELRLHIAPKTLSSSSRRDTRCSWTARDKERENKAHDETCHVRRCSGGDKSVKGHTLAFETA